MEVFTQTKTLGRDDIVCNVRMYFLLLSSACLNNFFCFGGQTGTRTMQDETPQKSVSSVSSRLKSSETITLIYSMPFYVRNLIILG